MFFCFLFFCVCGVFFKIIGSLGLHFTLKYLVERNWENAKKVYELHGSWKDM